MNVIKDGREILNKVENYEMQLNAFQNSYKKTRNDFSELKAITELNPEVTDALKQIQMKQHEDTVGSYEKLLTSLLMEVLPGYREIVLDLTTLRQSPALDVLIKKDPNNPPEDVLRGTGGSVTNIIVAGFRIISVIRSGNRRFLLLDEADCWLKEDYFPSFSKMLKEVSENLGVQILLISHDKNSYFTGVIDHQVEIYKDQNGKIHSKFDSLPDWDVDEDIIKSIHLENFQSHEDTFIPLSPTITILRGDNDIGKSAIASAFRAIFYGEGAASDIKHFAPKSVVTVEFNKEGKYLTWERKAKGRPVESYTMYSQAHGYQNPLHKTEGLSRGNVPDWLMAETGLGLFDGLDVQLTWQKNPLGFLNDGPHVRAKALAVGTEDDTLQNIMVLAKKKNTENKALLKAKEIVLEEQRQMIVVLKKIKEIQYAELKLSLDFIDRNTIELEKMNSLLEQWEKLEHKNVVYQKCDPIKEQQIHLEDHSLVIKGVEKSIGDIERELKIQDVLIKNNTIDKNIVLSMPTSKQLKETTDEILKVKNKIEKLGKIKNIEKVQHIENRQSVIQSLNQIIQENTLYSQKITVLKSVSSIEKVVMPENRNEIKKELVVLGIEWNKLNKINQILFKLNEVSIPASIKSEQNTINQMIEVGINMKKFEKEKEMYLNDLNSQTLIAQKLKEELLTDYPVCPTCHREWTKEHEHTN